MKLIDALRKAAQVDQRSGEPLDVFLGCGFSPLHLATFLKAWLGERSAGRPVRVLTGLFGDLPGNLRLAADARASAVAVMIEWPDLDPRLGWRHSGGWDANSRQDILAAGEQAAARLEAGIQTLPSELPVAVSLPTLPLAPMFPAAASVLSEDESRLRQYVAALGARLAARNRRVLNPDTLAERSPVASRADLSLDVKSGFPYSIAHTSAVAGMLAEALLPRAPLKGVITDLDDTLWQGIAGEIGPAAVSWTPEEGAQVHALYQQMLAQLAERGVLLAAASKNDPAVAEAALARPDLLVPRGAVYPVEANWGRKPESVRRILARWNVLSSSVMFIDDSPLELAEMQAAYPEMACRRFSKDRPEEVAALLGELRSLFYRQQVTLEDRLRVQSLRDGAAFEAESTSAGDADAFLRSVQAEVLIHHQAGRADARAFELVNKTNQFNLNGRRYQPDLWAERGRRPGDFVWTVSYQDRFGPLGKVAAIAGRRDGSEVEIEDWVLSCRAFSRRVEYVTLREIFRRFGASAIRAEYRKTARNGPLRDFLAGLKGGALEEGWVRITAGEVGGRLPELAHAVRIEPGRFETDQGA